MPGNHERRFVIYADFTACPERGGPNQALNQEFDMALRAKPKNLAGGKALLTKATRAVRVSRNRYQPALETLEDRVTPAGGEAIDSSKLPIVN